MVGLRCRDLESFSLIGPFYQKLWDQSSVWSKDIFLEFPFFAENMIIRSILNLWWHSEILKFILGVVKGDVYKKAKKDSSALIHCKI